MKRLAGMILLLLLAFSGMAQVKGYKVWAINDLISDNRFIWQNDTIKKDSLVYSQFSAGMDSVRFWRITGGAKSPWYKSGGGSGSMVYPAAGIALSNGSGWAASLTDNSAIWNKAITSDATFSAANYLLKTADTGRKAVASGIYEKSDGNIGVGTNNPYAKLHLTGGDFYQMWASNSPRFLFGDATSIYHYGGLKWNFNQTPTLSTLSIGASDLNGSINTMFFTSTQKVGIINSSPTARLHLPAGTATASTAPLKFTSGTNLTAPEAGAMEFDGSRLYFTPSTTRKTLSFDENIKTINGNSLIGTGDLTITASQVYPGAGLAKSTGSGWATSITDNSSNWNTAYGWGNHASQGYVNSILINGTSGENAGGFIDFIPQSGINITKSGGHVYFSATGGGSGTVTSVGLSAPTGFSVSGSPVTTSGTLALSFAAGYSLPSDATQANWTTAFNNRIATFTTTGNSGAATFSGNVLNIPNYTLAGLGGQPTVGANVSFGYNGNWVALDGSLVRYSNTILQRFADIGGGTYVGSTFPAASTTEAGLMSATDKTNLDAAVSNSGKVKLFGTSTWGELSANYFEWSTNSFRPIRDGSPQENSLYPITSGGVYTALLAKANLSGATFTGAISGTSATFSSTVTASDFQLSDRRLKTDIRRLKDISWADRIDFVSYRMKADSSQRLRYGVIAQDVEKYAPELVNTDENGTKSVSYIDLLIVKNQQLQNQINFQRYEILFSICLSCFLFVVVILRGSKRT